jgi:radical SAM protein with 4Fe4S-binding SPASM domain
MHLEHGEALTRPPLPLTLQVEVTAACNLRCRMCLVRYRPALDRLHASMSLATFSRLLEQLPHVESVVLQGLGEPLLAPDLMAMVQFAHRRGVVVGFNTNATVLTRSRADSLIASGLDWMCISLDGATAATYEAIREGAHFHQVLRNIRQLVEAKSAAAVDRPELSIVFVAMRRNIAELPALVRLASGLGVPDVSVQNLAHSFDDTVGRLGYDEIRHFTAEEMLVPGSSEVLHAFTGATVAADELGVRLHLPPLEEVSTAESPASEVPGSVSGHPHAGDDADTDQRRPALPCAWPWDAAYVGASGDVQPCCMVMGWDRASFGNLAAASFSDVWHGDAARAFRAALLSDEPPQVCRGCSFYHGRF